MVCPFIGWRVTTTAFNGQVDFQFGFGVIHSEQVQVGVDDFNFRRSDDIGRGNLPFTTDVQPQMSGFHIVHDQADLLDLQSYLNNIFPYARDIAELMQHIRDTDGRDGSAREG